LGLCRTEMNDLISKININNRDAKQTPPGFVGEEAAENSEW
jgi:hypothetical protein